MNKHVFFFFLIIILTVSNPIDSRLNTKTSPQSIYTYYFILFHTAGPFPPLHGFYSKFAVIRVPSVQYDVFPPIDVIEFNLRGRVTIVL